MENLEIIRKRIFLGSKMSCDILCFCFSDEPVKEGKQLSKEGSNNWRLRLGDACHKRLCAFSYGTLRNKTHTQTQTTTTHIKYRILLSVLCGV